jgi:hypothetical protein
MNLRLSLGAVALCAVFSSGLFALEQGEMAPDFALTKSWNAQPGVARLSDLRGKIVHLVFWGTW